jgi:superfamily I DNA/RNA helicase
MEDSKYQKRIYKEIVDSNTNIIIGAVAGSGKTTTLIGCLNLVPKGKDIAFLAFNNAIVEELKSRIKRRDVVVTTMHSFCWRSVMKSKGYKSELKPNKSLDHIKKVLIKNKVDIKRTAYYQYILSNIVDLMRMTLTFDKEEVIQLAFHHDINISEEEADMAVEVLKLMDKDDKVFDFTDMIYRVVSEDLRVAKFDYVFVDESQDLSRCQQNIITKILKKDGRLIAVGDPSQAIYGFAGADIDSYTRLKTLFDNTIELPLSVNYRCGTRIVERARKINPQIEPFKENKSGIVRDGFIDEIRSGDWVLCRNLKPLILANLYFLSIGVKSFVKGKDIGVGLISLVNKIGCETTKSMLVKYKQTIQKERMKLIKLGMRNPDNSEKIDGMNQKFDILSVLSEGLSYTKNLKENIKQIFKEQGEGICLSTIHKSKGLENDNVFILCPELIPNRFAVQDWQLKQEDNLLYVAITRAKKKLIFLSDYEEIIENQKKMLQNRKEL